MNENEIIPAVPPSSPSNMIAKRDFVIYQNDTRIEIKKGHDLKNVPEKYIQNLKTEGVL